MDEFKLILDEAIYRKTNAAWNELMLNDPWSVGYVSKLIEDRAFESKEEWEQYYYQSGRDRQAVVETMGENQQKWLNFYATKRDFITIFRRFTSEQITYNYQYGRTEADLYEKGKILFNYIQKHKPDQQLTIDICVESVRFRTICETWNGIIIRERNTVIALQSKFPKLAFNKTTGAFDHTYAVDYTIHQNGKMLCGIQIKPPSYSSTKDYVAKAKEANQRKNQTFSQTHKCPVFDIIANSDGTIINTQALGHLAEMLK